MSSFDLDALDALIENGSVHKRRLSTRIAEAVFYIVWASVIIAGGWLALCLHEGIAW